MNGSFSDDVVGGSAYDPCVILKIILLAYSQGLLSSHAIEHAFLRNAQFIAISREGQPSYANIAEFVCSLSAQSKHSSTRS